MFDKLMATAMQGQSGLSTFPGCYSLEYTPPPTKKRAAPPAAQTLQLYAGSTLECTDQVNKHYKITTTPPSEKKKKPQDLVCFLRRNTRTGGYDLYVKTPLGKHELFTGTVSKDNAEHFLGTGRRSTIWDGPSTVVKANTVATYVNTAGLPTAWADTTTQRAPAPLPTEAQPPIQPHVRYFRIPIPVGPGQQKQYLVLDVDQVKVNSGSEFQIKVYNPNPTKSDPWAVFTKNLDGSLTLNHPNTLLTLKPAAAAKIQAIVDRSQKLAELPRTIAKHFGTPGVYPDKQNEADMAPYEQAFNEVGLNDSRAVFSALAVQRGKPVADLVTELGFKEVPVRESSVYSPVLPEGQNPKEFSRYTNVPPGPVGLVSLPDHKSINGFLINANELELPGLTNRPLRILAQGPIVSEDFLEMVIRKGAGVIVQTTPFLEPFKARLGAKAEMVNAKPYDRKCASYLPMDFDPETHAPKESLLASVSHGSLTVSVAETEVKPGYTRSLLAIYDAKTSLTHHIEHYYVHDIEDHGIPKQDTLASTMEVVTRNVDKPMVIHCSAGLGRTGLYTALDAMVSLSLKRTPVDAYPFDTDTEAATKALLEGIRMCRPGAVQDPIQLAFMLKCAEAIFGPIEV